MQFVIIENGYHEESDHTCYTVLYTKPNLKEFYFKAKTGSKTVDKVVEAMENNGFLRFYVVEDSGKLPDLWQGYEDEETVLSYISTQML